MLRMHRPWEDQATLQSFPKINPTESIQHARAAIASVPGFGPDCISCISKPISLQLSVVGYRASDWSRTSVQKSSPDYAAPSSEQRLGPKYFTLADLKRSLTEAKSTLSAHCCPVSQARPELFQHCRASFSTITMCLPRHSPQRNLNNANLRSETLHIFQ